MRWDVRGDRERPWQGLGCVHRLVIGREGTGRTEGTGVRLARVRIGPAQAA